MQGASIMVVNQYEAHLIEEKSGMTFNDLRSCVETLLITHGKDGSHIYQGDTITEVGTFAPSEIKDPTGAGDAFRAGFITGLAKNLPVKLAAEMGALCATYVLEQIGTQNHRFNTVEFIARFRQTHDDQGQLNALLA
jgi:adenosine kinase